jgi:hypothetical protein
MATCHHHLLSYFFGRQLWRSQLEDTGCLGSLQDHAITYVEKWVARVFGSFWPPVDNVFLKVEKGSFVWFKTKESQNLPSSCVKCHNSICGESACCCLVCLPVMGGKNFHISPAFSLNWPVLLDSLPVLAPAHMESMLKRRSITMAVRSIARFLAISLPEDILKVWYGIHLQASKSIANFQQISSSEISTFK